MTGTSSPAHGAALLAWRLARWHVKRFMSRRTAQIRNVMLIAYAAVALPSPAGAQLGLLSAGPASFAPLVRAVAPGVVGIAILESGDAPLHQATPVLPRHPPGRTLTPQAPASQAAGSGFLITANGMIVTNNHVIAGAAKITVTLNDGEHYVAHVVGRDDLTDLAVIKITSSKALPSAHWGNSAAMSVGDWILAAGNPFALGNSFTAGIISAEGRDIGDGPFDHFLQLDAPINPGNSGGPSFNMNGAVIGVNTAIVSPSGGSVGIGFAIPSNTARQVVAALIANGDIPRGWLGISVADLPAPANVALPGAAITGVEPDGPAYKVGLTSSDIILTVNGTAIEGASDLIRAIASAVPGTKVRLGVERNGHILTLPVVVSRRPAQLGE